jgi:hypothetical protein
VQDEAMPDASVLASSTGAASATAQTAATLSATLQTEARAPNSPVLMKLLIETHARANFAEGQLYEIQQQRMMSERAASERRFGQLLSVNQKN